MTMSASPFELGDLLLRHDHFAEPLVHALHGDAAEEGFADRVFPVALHLEDVPVPLAHHRRVIVGRSLDRLGIFVAGKRVCDLGGSAVILDVVNGGRVGRRNHLVGGQLLVLVRRVVGHGHRSGVWGKSEGEGNDQLVRSTRRSTNHQNRS